MLINFQRARQLLQGFQFRELFIEELGWANPHIPPVQLQVDGVRYALTPIAEQGGMFVFEVANLNDGRLPSRPTRLHIERQLTPLYYEHLLIFTNPARTASVWQWVKRETGKAAEREKRYDHTQPGDSLLQRLSGIAFRFEDLDEEGKTTIGAVLDRVKAAFDVERVTKRFYEEFKKHHDIFLGFIQGIEQLEHRPWYASVMLNRLMFIYFIQKKGFLDGDPDYLSHKLQACQAQGVPYHRGFLGRLFFEGFAGQPDERSPEAQALLGDVPFLNGGIFLPHPLERDYPDIAIADAAFAELFAFFNRYTWHLDDRPLRADNEINPDVLGYIFEKYINQKQMGAYYTKEDITEYISKNTLIPFLFDAARRECKIAFEGEQSLWRSLQADPDRYLYDAVRRGVIDDDGNVIPETALPDLVQQGMRDPQARRSDRRYNLGEAFLPDAAGNNLALPTETWREYVARRQRCLELRQKLANGDLRHVNDLITYNLNLRQFAQDVIEDCEGPELLRAFWHALENVTVLDPTCGSGAFLFAALNVLEPLYAAGLHRMAQFLADLDRGADAPSASQTGGLHHGKFSDFRRVLEGVQKHPNRRYFILKSIIVNNLFGVDLMEEAVEICKLRLFLKLVAQVEKDDSKPNMGLEPLPDIDFNIRAGNTLVGYATYDDVQRAVTSRLDFEGAMERIEEKAQDVDRLFGHFRQQQTELGGEVTPADKQALRGRLKELEDELNRYLAGEYGVDVAQRSAYEKWLHSHKPFHWFIEFYGIVHKRGGFDVIIGNPPYVELKALTDYRTHRYTCEDAGNLYALIMERCSLLCPRTGRQGFIVPVSSVSTDRYSSLQCLITKYRLHYSSFDDRPSRLFDGLEHIRLTIHLLGEPLQVPLSFSTRYNKWTAVERPTLFERLVYAPVWGSSVDGSLPKLSSEIDEDILRKLTTQKSSLSTCYARNGSHRIFYSRKVGYFLQVLDFEPRVLDGKGNQRPPSEFKQLCFASESHAKTALCCLNSNLFYWFITVFSDCRHVNKREVDAFPVDIPKLASGKWGVSLLKLANDLMSDLKNNSEERKMRFGHDTLTVQCIIPKQSKPLLDEIDRVLARHYGFTEEELDFILHYDLKYRLGREGAEE